MTDVRDEAQVQAAVDRAVETFGSIDILVNNASAISLTGTAETPMKRFDLMHQVNARGTFVCIQKCLPHLRRAANPHVLNISPPLNLDPLVRASCAYTMSKYGMSLVVWGWPRNSGATVAFNACGRAQRSDGGHQLDRREEAMSAAAAPPSLPTPPTRSSRPSRAR